MKLTLNFGSIVGSALVVTATGLVSAATYDGATSLIQGRNANGTTHAWLSGKCASGGMAQAACLLKPGAALSSEIGRAFLTP